MAAVGFLLALAVMSAAGQTPQPFPRAGAPAQQPPAPRQAPTQPSPPAPAPPPAAAPLSPGEPTAASLGFPIYPGAQFLASYDAGRSQRYYVFGSTTPFNEVVLFYRTQLDDRGDLVFKEPATHMFSIGRFRDETMAFPPGVTVKDWTSGGSQGYPNAKLGGQPASFPTVIMIVPAQPAAPAANR